MSWKPWVNGAPVEGVDKPSAAISPDKRMKPYVQLLEPKKKKSSNG